MTANPLAELSIDDLRRRSSRKWRTYPADVLPMWIAEMDVNLAPPISDALRTAISIGDTGYPAGADLAAAFSGFAHRHWGWSVDPDTTTSMPDVMRGMTTLLDLITDPGDALVITSPVYPPFFAFTRNAGRRVVEAPLGTDGRLDLDTLEAAFASEHGKGRCALLISNPHNPTGVVHTASELAAVATLATSYNVRVISDEIHAPLVLPGATFTPYLTLPNTRDAFALTSASKGWNLPGIKAALAIAGTESTLELQGLPAQVSLGASHLGNIAHTAAFAAGDDWLEALLSGLVENRATIDEWVSATDGIEWIPPQATYLAWLDCSALRPRMGTKSCGDHFLEHARVALNDGGDFGDPGAGHVRLNYATGLETLLVGLDRISRAVRRPPEPR